MTTPDAEPPLPSEHQEQIEAITRIVRQVLAEQAAPTPVKKRGAYRLVEQIKQNWQFIVVLFTVLLAGIAWVWLGVDPLESARDMKYRKDQRDAQRAMARHHVDLGNDFLNMGQLEAAGTEFEEAKKLDTYNAEADFGLLKVSVFKPVVAGRNEYDPEVVERRIKSILRQKPADTHALAFEGDVFRSIDAEKALQYYDQAIKSDASNAQAYYGKGLLLDTSGERSQALEMYEKAVALSPWNQTFRNNLAYQHYLNGDYQSAQENYVFLLRLEPGYLLSRCMLANAQWRLGGDSYAYQDLKYFDEALKDETTFKVSRNQGVWFFHTEEPALVQMYSQAEKTAYARYLMALASHLLKNDRETKLRVAQAEAAGAEASAKARRVIAADVSALIQTRPELKSQLRTFSAIIERR